MIILELTLQTKLIYSKCYKEKFKVKRVDVQGSTHTNRDGTKVKTPHIHTKGSKDVRPAIKGEDY